MKLSTKLFIGGGLVVGTGLAVYGIRRFNDGKEILIVDEYILDSKETAESVLKTLNEVAEKYDNVSVGDYYDTLGMPSSFITNGYGWSVKAISKAKIKKVRGGYVIRFPRAEVIK